MNKRHNGKLLAFLLAVVFMFALIPQVFAAGEDKTLILEEVTVTITQNGIPIGVGDTIDSYC